MTLSRQLTLDELPHFELGRVMRERTLARFPVVKPLDAIKHFVVCSQYLVGFDLAVYGVDKVLAVEIDVGPAFVMRSAERLAIPKIGKDFLFQGLDGLRILFHTR